MCHLGFIDTVRAIGDIPVPKAEHRAGRSLGDLALLRRVRDRIDREWAGPLDVEALARDAGIPPGTLSRWFEIAYGRSPYSYVVCRRVERARLSPKCSTG